MTHVQYYVSKKYVFFNFRISIITNPSWVRIPLKLTLSESKKYKKCFFLYFQIRAAGKDRIGFPTHVRSGISEFGKPEILIDQAHEWILDQACSEGKKEARPMKVNLPGEVSVEFPVTPTVLASLFGILNAVLLGVIGWLWNLLRRERASHSQGPLAAILPPNRAAARLRQMLLPEARVPPTINNVDNGALRLQPVGATAPPHPQPPRPYTRTLGRFIS